MNKEINKIIEEIKSYENEEMCMILLSQKQNKALLKYITNLQEENKQLKELQRKIDVLTYLIKHLDYLDIWNDYNTSELEEIIYNGEE